MRFSCQPSLPVLFTPCLCGSACARTAWLYPISFSVSLPHTRLLTLVHRTICLSIWAFSLMQVKTRTVFEIPIVYNIISLLLCLYFRNLICLQIDINRLSLVCLYIFSVIDVFVFIILSILYVSSVIKYTPPPPFPTKRKFTIILCAF